MDERLQYLFARYVDGTCSLKEEQELSALALASANEKDVRALLGQAWDKIVSQEAMPEEKSAQIIDSILRQVPANNVYQLSPHLKAGKRWKQVAIAASVLLVIGLGSYFLFFNQPSKQTEIIVKTQEERFKNDVDPGEYKARLTLADGRTIVLDSAAEGELTKQGGTVVMNKDGQLLYNTKNKNNEVLYNTLSTAKGEMYKTVLADGSKVWLNSASGIKFPVAFVGNERKVEITGEAYFEVRHNDKMPFVVSVNGMEVHDLGTSFNINAYNDEPVINTTLVEGSARVVKGSRNQLLSPGQQAQLNSGSSEIKLITHADVAAATAWKNGVFQLNAASIETIMRQIARWYDVDIIYEGGQVKQVFYGTIPRTVSAANVFKVLEER